MSLFHHHEREDAGRPEDAASFEVLGADGKVRRYARDQFDMIVDTKDPEEVRRQVEHGWVILDERQVESGGRGPSSDDLIIGIQSVRVGGVLGYERGETVTWHTIGCLGDGAQGDPVD